MIHTAQDQGQHEIHQTWALLMLLLLIIHILKWLFLMLIYFYYGQNGLKIFFIHYVSDEMALSFTWYLRLGRDDRSMLFNSYDSDELAEFLKLLWWIEWIDKEYCIWTGLIEMVISMEFCCRCLKCNIKLQLVVALILNDF